MKNYENQKEERKWIKKWMKEKVKENHVKSFNERNEDKKCQLQRRKTSSQNNCRFQLPRSDA